MEGRRMSKEKREPAGSSGGRALGVRSRRDTAQLCFVPGDPDHGAGPNLQQVMMTLVDCPSAVPSQMPTQDSASPLRFDHSSRLRGTVGPVRTHEVPPFSSSGWSGGQKAVAATAPFSIVVDTWLVVMQLKVMGLTTPGAPVSPVGPAGPAGPTAPVSPLSPLSPLGHTGQPDAARSHTVTGRHKKATHKVENHNEQQPSRADLSACLRTVGQSAVSAA